jgi:cell division protein FtsQ
VKKILNIGVWILLLSGVVALYGFAREKQKNALCYDVEVRIDKPANSNFTDESDIRNLFRTRGIAVEGAPLRKLPLHQLELAAASHNAVAQAQVYLTLDGKLVVEIVERTPLLRIFNSFGESYYLDSRGSLMHLSNKHTARALVASGHIGLPLREVAHLENIERDLRRLFRPRNNTAIQNAKMIDRMQLADTIAGRKQLMSLFELSSFIAASDFWNAQISQIYVESNGDYVLIPRVGNHKIIMGKPIDIEEKFANLKLFYQKGLPRVGWNEFSAVNLSFKHQIVCTKRQDI